MEVVNFDVNEHMGLYEIETNSLVYFLAIRASTVIAMFLFTISLFLLFKLLSR